MPPKKQYLVEFTPPELTTIHNELKLPQQKEKIILNSKSAQSPGKTPAVATPAGFSSVSRASDFLHSHGSRKSPASDFTVVIVRFECRRSKQHRTCKQSYSRRDDTTARRGRWCHCFDTHFLFRPTLYRRDSGEDTAVLVLRTSAFRRFTSCLCCCILSLSSGH